METNFQFVLKGDKQGSDWKDEANSRPKRNAAELAKLRIKYASGINWRESSAKYFWHALKVKDKSHVFCKFLSSQFSWKFVFKIFDFIQSSKTEEKNNTK